ncbi:MAG TPA: hypothetical protein VJ242_02630 [Patescibacteria group bacterium]|nr:hypothetical protein [Patescibacteria group bacterium]
MAEPIPVTNPIKPLFGGYAPGSNTTTGAQVEAVLSTVVSLLTVIAGLTFLFYFFIGALNLLTAGGDTQRVQKARQFISEGLIGIVITITAYGVVYVIGQLMGIDITQPSNVINTLIFN